MNRKDNKEADILKAAEKLFAQKGYKEATTTLIASEAGVTHAMLHYYFRTKEQIFLKVLDLYFNEIVADLKAIMVPETYDIGLIRRVTEICFDFFSRHRGHLALLMEMSREKPEILEENISRISLFLGSSMNAHRERIEKAVRDGAIKEITFHELLVDIVSVCAAPFLFSPMISNLAGMDEAQIEAFMERRKTEAVEMISGRLQPVEK